MSAFRHRCQVVRKKSRLKKRLGWRTIFPTILIAAAFVGGGRAATIFFSSLQSCNEQCVDRNLATPLPSGSTNWAGVSLADCDFDCRIQSCRVGCQDLEAFNSTCDAKCDEASVKSVDSCRQGCRAVADIFLHQIQYLLNYVTVEIVYDALQGIRLSWSIEDTYSNTLQEIAAANLRWVAQSRPGCTDPFMALPGWRWTYLDSKAFKDSSNMQFTVYVPFEGVSDIQVRLAIIWRDTVAVSPAFSQSLILSADDELDRNGVTRRRNRIRRLAFGQLQWSADGYVVCWHSERERILHDHESAARRFRLRLFHTSGVADKSEHISNDGQKHHDSESQSTMMTTKDDHVTLNDNGKPMGGGGDDIESDQMMTRTKSSSADAATDLRINAKRSPENSSFYTTVEEDFNSVIDAMVMLESPKRVVRTKRSEPSNKLMAPLIRTEFTGASCYLLRRLPRKRCCRVGITEVDSASSDGSTATTTTTSGESSREADKEERMVEIGEDELLLDISLSLVAAKEKHDPFIVFTNGRQLLVIENVDDFVMLAEPRDIPFPLSDDVSITALTAISHNHLYVGLSDGSIYSMSVPSMLHNTMGDNGNGDGSKNHHHRSVMLDTNSTTNDELLDPEKKSAVKREPASAPLTEHLTQIRDADGTSVTQIAADDAQARLYVVRGGGGGLIRCASLTNCGERNATVLSSSASSPNNAINNIAIDAWNGFLFYATTGGDVFSTPLFPQDATGPYTLSITRRLADIPPVFTIEVDAAEQKLMAVLRNGSLLSRDLVDESVRDERADYESNDVPKAVTRSQFHANRLFWVSRSCGDSHPWDTCLHSEEINYSKKRIHLSRYLYGGRVREFVLMRDAYRPTFISPPSKIGLSIDDTEARLNWKPPVSLPFQAPGSMWRALAYEYTFSHVITSSTGGGSSSNNKDNKAASSSSLTTVTTVPVAFGNVSFINDVFLNIIDGVDDHHHHHLHHSHSYHDPGTRNVSSVGGGGPANQQPAAYVATVRACTRDFAVCSPPLRARNRALRPAAAVQKSVVLFARPVAAASGSSSSGIGGGPTSGFLSSLSNSIATSLFMDSANGGTRFAAMNMLGEEIGAGKQSFAPPLQLPQDVTATIAYDNTTGALYAAGGTEISIFRVLDDGIRYRFLDFLTVNQLCVMPIRASILLATQYSIVSYRLTSSFDRILYNCAGEECGEVVGLATDDHIQAGRIYYFLRQRNGTVDLYRRVMMTDGGGGGEAAQKIYSTNEFYVMRQMVLIDDRIVFLTRDGLVGAFDLRFHSWNFNLALRDVAFLLGAEWSTRSNRFQFRTGGGADDSIAGGGSGGAIGYDSTRGELLWRVESPGGGGTVNPSIWDERGNILYKIQLFRDNFGGDRTVALSAGRRFEIPRSVLDAWGSRQKFDVQIDAFNAWTVVSSNRTSVTAPTKPPSAPSNLRIYATQQKTLDGTRANIDLFWEEPSEWNGDMLGYVVNCTWENGTQLVNESVSARHSRAYSFVVKSGRIGCSVAGTNEQNLIGAFSDRVTIDGSDFRPLIRLFAIDSTDSLVAISNWSIPTPDSAKLLVGGSLSGSLVALTNAPPQPQRQRRQTASASSSQSTYQYQTLAFVGVELYAIRKEADALFLVMLDINDINVVLYKGSLSGDFSGQIEAMTSDWVAYRLLLVANHELMQISLDSLQAASSITPKRLFSLSSGAQDAKQLIFDPFASTAYLLTKNGSLFSLNLNGGAGAELNLALELECLRSQTVTSIVAEFAWNRATSPLIYALTWNGMIAINTAAIDASSGGDKMEIGPPVQLISEFTGASAKSGAEMASSVGGAGGTESSGSVLSPSVSGGGGGVGDPTSAGITNGGSTATKDASQDGLSTNSGGGSSAVDTTSERQRSVASTTTTTLRCSDVSVNWTLFGEKGLKAISSFTVADKLFIFFTSTELLIYDHQLALVSPVPIANSPLRQILAASQSSQPYPERSCFALPSPTRINFTVRNEGRTGAVVEVDEPSAPYANCPHVSTPQIQYQLQFWRRGTDKVKLKTGYTRVTHVDNGVLDKETDYDVTVYWYNRYSTPTSAGGGIFAPQPPVELPRRAFRTGYGYPSAPLEPFAWPVTPDAVLLNWKLPATLNAPPAEIKYRITQLSSTLLASVPIGVKQLTESTVGAGGGGGTSGSGTTISTAEAGVATGAAANAAAVASTSTSPSMISDVVECVRDPCRVLIPNLRPSVDYQFWVTAIHVGRLNALSTQLVSSSDDVEATSGDASARTKDVPGILRVEELTSDAALLRWSWLNPHSSPPTRIFVQYRQSGVDASWIELRHTGFDPTATAAATRNITIDGLRSATTYDFRYAADYAGEYPYGGATYRFAESFYQQSLQARTKAGTPSAPEDVKIERDGNHWTLRWSSPRSDGGEPIQSYAVEFRPRDSVEWEIAERGLSPSRLEWKIVQRRPSPDSGTDKSAVTSDGEPLRSNADSASSTDVESGAAKPPSSDTEEHLPSRNADGDASAAAGSDDVKELPDWRETAAAYRVRAANSEGFGGYAVVSATDDGADASLSDASSDNRSGTKGAAAPSSPADAEVAAADAAASRRRFWLFVLLVFSLAICPAATVFIVMRSRNIRRQRAKEKIHKVISLENITSQIQFPASPAHFPPEVENELKNLPQIPVGAVERLSLLGTGSFGEVFEGVAYDPDNLGPKSVRVAVKQLKDDNHDENRIRFLKEAILMNNFDHPNIVKLLGVQRAVKPHFLVIELMEGGELHKFLQASRPHGERASQLSLREMVSMMIDIGRGCAYLESFRHVHRDLATRNCLISSRHSAYRVTKIADFGLAREVSMQDYYRVHGADFLPLRWLAPESISHGVFTTKSDVWAFGIVVWEIMTLGQQPYPGHSNTEVITRIQAGRAPSRPKECPDEIYEIMRMAWTADEEKRPRFAELLPKLEAFRSKPHLQTDGPFPPTRHSAIYGGGGGGAYGVGGAPTSGANLAGGELLFGSSQDSSESGANGAANAATTTSCSTTTSGRSAAWNVAAAAAVARSSTAAADSDSVASGGGRHGTAPPWTANQRFNKNDRSLRPTAPGGGSPLDAGRFLFSSLSTVQMGGGGSAIDGRPESAFSGETMSTTLNDDYEIPRKGFFGGGSATASTRGGASSASHSNADSAQYLHPPFNRARSGSTVAYPNPMKDTPPAFHALAQRQRANQYGNSGYVHDGEPATGVAAGNAECFNASFPTVRGGSRKSNPPSYYNCYPLERSNNNTVARVGGGGGRVNPSFEIESERTANGNNTYANNNDDRLRRRRRSRGRGDGGDDDDGNGDGSRDTVNSTDSNNSGSLSSNGAGGKVIISEV